MKNMRILTWNINGIRAMKTPLKQLFDSLNADIICLQETKITRDLLDEPIANVEGYKSFFSFSKKRSGYSGVAIYCNEAFVPVSAEEGLSGILASSPGQGSIGCYGSTSCFSDEDLTSLDSEGRSILTQHKICVEGKMKELVIICVYCPRAASDNEERQAYKLKFYQLLQSRAESLVKAGRHVVIVGDVNSCHRPIDHCDPQDEEYFMCHPGRKWLDRFLLDLHGTVPDETKQPIGGDDDIDENDSLTEQSEKLFVDTFRFMHPTRTQAFTCWRTLTNARETNYGTRIDFIFADVELLKTQVIDCDIMPEVEGSDHCPVKAELKCTCVSSEKLPALCAKLMPEFSGKQQKLSSFFTKLSPSKIPMAPVMPLNKEGSTSKKIGRLKRSGKSDGSKSKKFKSNTTKGNLLSFFSKTTSNSADKEVAPSTTKINDDEETGAKSLEGSQASKVGETEEKEDGLSQPSSQSSNASVEESSDASVKGKAELTSSWKTLFCGLPPPPKCKGHNEDCVMRTVRKAGPNYGKQFYVCARGEGHKSNPEARCNFFLWKKK